MFSVPVAAQYDEGNEVTAVETGNGEDTPANNESYLSFNDQVSDGNSVVVETVFLPEGGYVAIHEVVDGAVGPLVGSSAYLEPGEHSLIDVELGQALDSDRELIAMPHRDDGNEVYEFPGPDVPYSENGDPVQDQAVISIGSVMTNGDIASTIVFDDQAIEGNTVLVTSVSFPEGGYVVIHESENGSAGATIGNSEYMEAGDYSNVEVELDTPINTGQELIAMTHIDDGDQVYQFPGPDVPYTSNGTPVIDPAMVTLESTPSSQTPGFKILLAIGVLFVAGYSYRRKQYK